MLRIQKYGAIDIGSNAIRLLIANVIEQPGKKAIFRKSALIRVPIRLGEDVFKDHYISDANLQRMLDAMMAFRLLMNAHKVTQYRACATSAMREATNGPAVAKRIKDKTTIDIEIIGGDEEAAIIAATDLYTIIDSDKHYLYVDVGGGSTEFTIYSHGSVVKSRSFQIGTVRILNGLVTEKYWSDLEKWIRTSTAPYDDIDIIGSGGNINKIFKLSGKKVGKPLSYLFLSSFYKEIQGYSYDDRIITLGLNQDRADVIIPATRIYLSAMKWARSKQIFVPKIGLADGIIKSQYLASKNYKY
ncbi:MAG: exopolyphosphatase/guanosine-5'-triphosphate,3'-diphosphate pyrophosphatase [Flavobacteriales bacterium]|jgi:exopolyphosphatase/guanosine-5'-triphosphate,3'-diphosphate pyrophosphatase